MELTQEPLQRLTGIVVHGKQLGRKLGYPTANLRLDQPEDLQLTPGVYAATALLANGQQHRAMVNIGYRPTVDPEGVPISVEAHLCDFNGDLYDQPLCLMIGNRIRNERRMESLDELRRQLAIDLEAVRSL